jgi:hypothetical protein
MRCSQPASQPASQPQGRQAEQGRAEQGSEAAGASEREQSRDSERAGRAIYRSLYYARHSVATGHRPRPPRLAPTVWGELRRAGSVVLLSPDWKRRPGLNRIGKVEYDDIECALIVLEIFLAVVVDKRRTAVLVRACGVLWKLTVIIRGNGTATVVSHSIHTASQQNGLELSTHATQWHGCSMLLLLLPAAAKDETWAARCGSRALSEDFAQLAIDINHHSRLHGRMPQHLAQCGTLAAAADEHVLRVRVGAHRGLRARGHPSERRASSVRAARGGGQSTRSTSSSWPRSPAPTTRGRRTRHFLQS